MMTASMGFIPYAHGDHDDEVFVRHVMNMARSLKRKDPKARADVSRGYKIRNHELQEESHLHWHGGFH